MMDEKQTQILLSLRKITEDVASCKQQSQKVDLLVKSIRQTIHADCCSLYLSDEIQNRYRLVATDGLLQAAVGKATLGFGEGLVGVVGQKKEILDLADAPSHPNFKYLPDVGEDEYHSFLGVPILNQGKLLGVLVVQSKEQKQFGEIEESFLVTLSAQIAKVLADAKNFADTTQLVTVHGTSGTGDIAIGTAMVWQPAVSIDKVKILHCDDALLQQELFLQALFQLQIDMDKAALRMQEADNEQAACGYLQGYGKMLDDTTFQDEVVDRILNEGLLASSAIRLVYEKRYKEAQERQDKDACLDIKDFAQVLLSRLLHASPKEFENANQVILVVNNLSLTLVAELPKDKIVGFVATSSLSSTHAIILARDLGIPVVVGANLDLNLIDGRTLVIDGEDASVLIDPPTSVIDEFSQLVNQSKERTNLYTQEKNKPTVTLDGEKISIKLNAGLNSKDDDTVENEVDGVGLYRTEIAYMLMQSFPSEQQQYEWYSDLLEKFKHKKVCMRTLDIGSDKGLSYFNKKEQNPALGFRGIRVTIDQPQLLNTQIRAMLRANQPFGNLEIMLPMVSSIEEIEFVKKRMFDIAKELETSTNEKIIIPQFGVMIEVPSLIYLLDDIKDSVDFFSIGSNDLTQYLLAVDRTNPQVKHFYDYFHPSVIRALALIKKKCDAMKKPISVCGELAGDVLGSMLLMSLGYNILSMNYSEIDRIKFITRRICIKDLLEIGKQATTLTKAKEIKELYINYAKENGLSKIIEGNTSPLKQ